MKFKNDPNIYTGYTDEKLESLSKINSRFESGVAYWASVESESSSFGKTLRVWSLFPNFLPMYVCSDHAVHWESKCWPNETNSPYKVYLTWNSKKNEKMNNVAGKQSHYIPHPWVNYRKKFYHPVSANLQRGTLVFFPHSGETSYPVFEDLDAYILKLKSLPKEYHPIVICLLYSDIEKGLHLKLRGYGLPLITAGTMISQKFVDRFYGILLNFKYSTSPNIGSHTFYSIEAGVNFFLYGEEPRYHIKNSNMLKDGELNLNDYGDDEDIENLLKLQSMLSYGSNSEIKQLQNIVSSYMGLDSEVPNRMLFFILWREFILHIGLFALYYLKRTFKIPLKLFKLIDDFMRRYKKKQINMR